MKKVSLILLTVLALATAGRVSAVDSTLRLLFESSRPNSLIGKLNKAAVDIDGRLREIKAAEEARDAKEGKQWRITRSLKRFGRHVGRHKKTYFIGLPLTIAAGYAAYAYGPSAYDGLNQWMYPPSTPPSFTLQDQCNIDPVINGIDNCLNNKDGKTTSECAGQILQNAEIRDSIPNNIDTNIPESGPTMGPDSDSIENCLNNGAGTTTSDCAGQILQNAEIRDSIPNNIDTNIPEQGPESTAEPKCYPTGSDVDWAARLFNCGHSWWNGCYN